jgi:hypothetical protein
MISTSYFGDFQGVKGSTPYQHEFTITSLTGSFRLSSAFSADNETAPSQELDLDLRQVIDLALGV